MPLEHVVLQVELPSVPLFVVALLIVVSLFAALAVYKDSRNRNIDYSRAWAICMFVWGMSGFFPLFFGAALYLTLRDQLSLPD
jgi:TctA family transporter